MRLKKLLLFIILIYFSIQPLLLANSIHNLGNEAILAKVTKKNGDANNLVVNPAQSLPLPVDTTQVKIVPLLSVRGDEEVYVVIHQANGIKSEIKKFGDSVKFGEKDKPKPSAANSQPIAKNNSNVAVDVVCKRRSGLPQTKRVNPGMTEKLPEDTLVVRVEPAAGIKGDETVLVEIQLTNGKKETIKSFGGYVDLEKAKTASTFAITLPSMVPKQ